MKKKALRALLLFFVVLLVSCAVSKPYYSDSPFPKKTSVTENINGNFPEAVYIKTRTQTFNTYHYYILHEGHIWYKSIDPQKEPKDWTLFMKTGLPNNDRPGFQKTNAVTEISADADELTALSVEGTIYSYCFDNTMANRANAWIDKQGWPIAEQFFFNRRTAHNRAWALGKRNYQVLYYEDIFGNQHHNGSMEIVTFYVLSEDGQEICYGDPGLPSDFSRNYTGPERGAFKAISLSASASTMFVINEAGEMYTRLADFDTIGCDPMFFKYTYVPYTSNLPGTDYFSNLNEWGLPSEEWRSQPRIPLAGKAAVTRHITILQNGQGNGARELRVAGLDAEGKTGYWYKSIFDTAWLFKTAPLYFAEDSVLITAVNYNAGTKGERGATPDRSYTGYRWIDNEKENGWEYQIPNFNILEGECDFRITYQGETCTLKLHPVEMWSYLKRDYLPGRTGSPKMFLVTLEVPENAFKSLSDAFVRQLTAQYAQYNRELFRFTIAATNNYIIMRDINNTGPFLFLTDGTIPPHKSELHTGRYIENFAEVPRYYSPELTVGKNTAVTRAELRKKIMLNRQFVNELKYKIEILKLSQLTAFNINAGYLPAHYIAKITPLQFIDIPKIRTMTSYGEQLVLANSAYVYTVTNAQIRLYERIIELLETRTLCYSNLAKRRFRSSSNIETPPWYSDNISDYWEIAGLPRTIAGTFYSPGIGDFSVQMPAALSIVPSPAEQAISGWFFSIGESNNFSIFIESRNSAKMIYSRKGKTPQKQKLQLDCVLYINNNANAPTEKDVIERCLRPYLITGIAESINVRIIFDGKTFEIREYPLQRGSFPVFSGIMDR